VRAVLESAELASAANVLGGQITYRAVADAFGLPYVPAVDAAKALH
jgi:alanine dehydrogenase